MIPQKAIALILDAEGIDQPSEWPGEESGITIGRGYDLGYEKDFARDWAGHLPPSQIELLETALGVTGPAGARISHRFRDIKIWREAADAVFLRHTLPHYEDETRRAFPGIEKLPPLVFGALVSLVFNRGSGMAGPRRAEMRNIRDEIEVLDTLLFSKDPPADAVRNCCTRIAAQLRAMKRLWDPAKVRGLIIRRENEALLVESAIGGAA